MLRSSRCLLIGDKWFFCVPLPVHWITWFRGCLPGFSMAKWLFSLLQLGGVGERDFETVWISHPSSHFVESFNSLCLMASWHRCFLFSAVGYLWLLSSFFMFRLFWFSQWECLRAGFCVLLPCPQPSLSTSLLKAHLPQPWNRPFLQGTSPSAQVLSSLWLGSNSSFWVSGPRSPIGYPPFSTQALTALLGCPLPLAYTLDDTTWTHGCPRLGSNSHPPHRALEPPLDSMPHCGPRRWVPPCCGYLLCYVLPNSFRTELLRKERSQYLSSKWKVKYVEDHWKLTCSELDCHG